MRERERGRHTNTHKDSNLEMFCHHRRSWCIGVPGEREREAKRWSTFGQHMSRMCSGHEEGGGEGRKKNRGCPGEDNGTNGGVETICKVTIHAIHFELRSEIDSSV